MAFDMTSLMGLGGMGGGDPALEQQMRNQALLRLGLGMMQGSGSGQPTGAIMGQAGLGTLGDMQQIGQLAYLNKMRQNQQERDSKLFEQHTQLNENKLAEDERQRTVTANVQALIDKGDSEGAARLALTSGNPQLANWGADVLKPGGTGTANMRDFQMLEELRKKDPVAAERFQNILQPPRSAYFSPDKMVDKDGNVVPLKFDARSGNWSVSPIQGLGNPGGAAPPAMPPAGAPMPAAPPGGLGSPPPIAAPQGGLGAPGRGLVPVSVSAPLQGNVSQSRAQGEAVGKATGEAKVGLPGALQMVDSAVNNIDQLIGNPETGASPHPGLGTATGLSGTLDPRNYVPGTNATNFKARLDQLKGSVFLDAYQQLKGAGQITEVEGKKAEQAKARLDTAQSDEEFITALKDYRDALARGRAILIQKAGGQAPGAPTQPTTTQRRLKFNPATGNLE